MKTFKIKFAGGRVKILQNEKVGKGIIAVNMMVKKKKKNLDEIMYRKKNNLMQSLGSTDSNA